MTDIAQIKDGKVVNIIVASLEWAQENASEGFDTCVECVGVGRGWLYDGETFSPPPSATEEPEEEEPKLTQLEFIRRFTLSERVKIQTSEDPVMQDAMLMLQVAQYIKLTDPDTIAFVQYAAYNNYIDQHRIEEILEITQEE